MATNPTDVAQLKLILTQVVAKPQNYSLIAVRAMEVIAQLETAEAIRSIATALKLRP